jgi:hypothetical protein
MAGYYLLVGRGRESQGKFAEAARAYLEFADLGDGDLVPVPGDSALRVSPAVFVRGRLAALFKVAPADQRKKIEEEIERRFKKLKSEK